MTGSGFTVILAVLEFPVPVIVAVRVSFSWEVIPTGAVYVTVAPVILVRDPHADDVHELLAIDQDTGSFPERAAVN
jgi:hypothetical protein